METARLVVDTDVIVDHLRGRGGLIFEALENVRCAFTAVTIYELKAVQNLRHEQSLQLRALTKRVEILSLDSTAADVSAEIWRSLAGRGMSISLSDTLVAGICLAADLPLLTRNVK